MRKTGTFFLVIVLLFSCVGCKKQASVRITDVNNLGGIRVGVGMGWASDYCLSDRKDVELVRYDMVADMLLALGYGYIDALSVDSFTGATVMAKTNGIERAEDAVGSDNMVYLIGTDKIDILLPALQEYMETYNETEEYREFLQRVYAFDGINDTSMDIPLTGTGETIRVSLDIDEYPLSYVDAQGNPHGYNWEYLVRFANAYNFRLECTPTSYTDAMMGCYYGNYDICITFLSYNEFSGMEELLDDMNCAISPKFLEYFMYLYTIPDRNTYSINEMIDD